MIHDRGEIVHTGQPITVAARSKAWTVFARSNTGIVGSNRTRYVDGCAALRRTDPPSKEPYILCMLSVKVAEAPRIKHYAMKAYEGVDV
jgi:hypothetical protein